MKKARQNGFTLIELLVGLAISSIVIAGIFSIYWIQLKSKLAQEDTLEMQQNLRAAMHVIEKDLRMAGHDPLGTAGAGFTDLLANQMTFTMDIDSDAGDGNPDGETDDANEIIGYNLGAQATLQRSIAGFTQPIADFIDAVNFVYLDVDGNVTNDPLAVQSVQVTLVGRTRREPLQIGRVDNQAYQNLQGNVIYQGPGDSFRRMTLSTEVLCRNLNPI